MFPKTLRLLVLAGPALLAGAALKPQPGLLHHERLAASDLEVTGLVEGLRLGETGYLRYDDLLKLPQTRAVISDEPDFRGPPLHISGVSLETLAAAIGVQPQSDLIAAPCADRYKPYLPSEYVAQHHPILVLKIEGKPLDVWAKQAHQYDPSPYELLYDHFVPAFRVLAHSDQPQLPENLVRLEFTTQAAIFGAIAPRGNFAPGSPEENGFRIAKQNCLRCHYMGDAGGTKSGRTWLSLGEWAREQPAFFESYVKNPQKMETHAHMEGSPQYDKPTLDALAAYFRTFSDAPAKGVSR